MSESTKEDLFAAERRIKKKRSRSKPPITPEDIYRAIDKLRKAVERAAPPAAAAGGAAFSTAFRNLSMAR